MNTPVISNSPSPDPPQVDEYIKAFEMAPSGIFILDSEGRLIDVNERMSEIFGYARQEMRGQTLEMLLPERYRSIYLRQKKFLRESRHNRIKARRVFYGRRKDGTEIPVGMTISTCPGQESSLVIGVVADITKNRNLLHRYKQLGHYFQQLLDSSSTIIYVVDLSSYQETYITENVRRILGYSSEEILRERNFWCHHLHPDDRDQVLNEFQEQLESGKGVLEYRLRQANGEYVWIYDSFGVTRYQDGKAIELTGSWTDISSRKAAELQRDQIETELRLAQKLEAVGQLASGIAHEINTPIQFVGDSIYFLQSAFEDIQGLLGQYRTALSKFSSESCHDQVMAELREAEEEADLEYLEEEVPQAFSRIFEGLERVANIVRAMKEFGHVDQREKTPVDINKALQNTLTVARNEYKYVADLKTDFGDIPLVECLGGDINQVFLNLIVNAAHAIEDVVKDQGGKGEISIRTYRQEEEVVVEIRDTGSGIPADIAQRVFDPFFTTKEVGKGTGQGLAIARKIVMDKHGGVLTFDSQPGEGTTFFIRLPIRASQESEEIESEKDSVCG